MTQGLNHVWIWEDWLSGWIVVAEQNRSSMIFAAYIEEKSTKGVELLLISDTWIW
jgi:hypothetical protein